MNERISNILKSPLTIPSVVGLVAFGGGIGVGYILGRRKMFNEIMAEIDQELLDEMVEEDNEFFDVEGIASQRIIIDEEAYHSPAVIPEAEVLAPETDAEISEDGQSIIVRPGAVKRLDILDEEDEEEEPELIHVNVFNDGDWNWDDEIKIRDANPGRPYILHRDEFYRNEFDYTQTTLTYYEGDDILVPDGEQQPVFNHLDLTGPMIFGHGSGDPNVVLIRNDERKAEYEICRSEGLFTVEVLGLEIENNARVKDLKHSKVGKFRDMD